MYLHDKLHHSKDRVDAGARGRGGFLRRPLVVDSEIRRLAVQFTLASHGRSLSPSRPRNGGCGAWVVLHLHPGLCCTSLAFDVLPVRLSALDFSSQVRVMYRSMFLNAGAGDCHLLAAFRGTRRAPLLGSGGYDRQMSDLDLDRVLGDSSSQAGWMWEVR